MTERPSYDCQTAFGRKTADAARPRFALLDCYSIG